MLQYTEGPPLACMHDARSSLELQNLRMRLLCSHDVGGVVLAGALKTGAAAQLHVA